MNNSNKYDVLVIGGGISACVFASNYLKGNLNKKIAIIEAGRGLGGRCSTRKSKRFYGWELNHGSPNFNISNKGNNESLRNFVDELMKNKFIELDDSNLMQVSPGFESNSIKNSEFYSGQNYIPINSMSELSQNILNLNSLRNKIDFFFQTLIVDLLFTQNQWNLVAKNGDKFNCKYLVCSSNLLLHKRSMKLLNVNKVPLRKAIPIGRDKKIDTLLNILGKQSYIQRLSFLIYTKANYNYKDLYLKKNRYFNLGKDLENKFKFERIIFQLQKDNKLGVVIHTRDLNFISEYLNNKNEQIFINKLLTNFNKLFEDNPFINKLSCNEDVSIMRWRASQPYGAAVPIFFQFCRNYKIGFCGDWFEDYGFGRIEGAIVSGLRLANLFNNFN